MNDYQYLLHAKHLASQAECSRRQIGAIVVSHGTVVGRGHNGAPVGWPSCLGGACPRGKLTHEELASASEPFDTGIGRCIAIHAEARAILNSAKNLLAGSTMYVTDEPCWACSLLIAEVGIIKVVCLEKSETPERPGSAPGRYGRRYVLSAHDVSPSGVIGRVDRDMAERHDAVVEDISRPTTQRGVLPIQEDAQPLGPGMTIGAVDGVRLTPDTPVDRDQWPDGIPWNITRQ